LPNKYDYRTISYVSRTNRPATDDIGFLLARASARFNELLLARFTAAGYPDIRGSFGSVLVPLFERDGRRVGELAHAARLSKQSLTGLVAACEQAGLVERHRDAADGRAFVVRLTARGRRFQAVAEEVLDDLDRQLRDALGPRNHDALSKALKGVMEL
jgi:DNA-binding MarR family transcriptional regulator